MKSILKIITLFLIGCSSLSSYSQIETEDLGVLVIDKMSRNQIIEVIKKVRDQAYTNYVSDYEMYQISHWVQMNDTNVIIDSSEKYRVSIDFKGKKIKKSVVKDSANRNYTDSLFFSRYSFNDSPSYWVTEFILRKFVNVPHLDFFNYFDDYTFNRIVKGTDTLIDFYSKNGYEGSFLFNNKYQLKEIEISLVSPFPMSHTQSKNGKKMFDKSWLYTVENVVIKLDTNKQNELFIQSINVDETIIDYNFIRYNSKREILLEDKNLKFHTKLKMQKL